MRTSVIVAVGTVVICLGAFVGMNRHEPPQSKKAPTYCARFAMQKSFTPTPPPNTYAWTDTRINVWNPVAPVVVRHYKRFGIISNGLPAADLPASNRRWQKEKIVDIGGLDRVWYDPQKGIIGRAKQYVSIVECIDRENYKNIEVPYNSAYIFPEPVNAASHGFIGCSAVVLYDGHTLVFAHALGIDAPEACDPDKVTCANLFERLDKQLVWSEKWRCWIAAGTQADLSRFTDECTKRGIRVELRQVMGKAGHAAYWIQRTESFFVIPD